MLGKSRSFSMDEFNKQMANHKIVCIKSMSDDVVAIVEGGLMNPLEQDLLETLYFKKEIPIIRVATLEKELGSYIDDKKLLMSLKLSKDSQRLCGFLKNPLIPDSLFLKLLKIYDFKNEGFFDTDENRDISTSLIERFYDDLQANHNIQHISLGIIQLINRSENCELINTLASLKIVTSSLKKSDSELLEVIAQSLASHSCLDEQQQLKFARNGSCEVGVLLASREDLHVNLQEVLLVSKHKEVQQALACNASLSQKAIGALISDYESDIILHVNLNELLFKRFKDINAEYLAQNPTLLDDMIERLFLLQKSTIYTALAKNRRMTLKLAEKIVSLNSEKALQSLASNSSTPASILAKLCTNEDLHVNLAANTNLGEHYIKQLSRSSNIEILTALAKNSATPLEVLYEFLLDIRLENIVRQNPALNDKYQR